MKELLRVKITGNEAALVQAANVNYYNYESLATILVNTGNLTEELYEKIKNEYLKFAYEYTILRDALLDKYAGDLVYNSYEILYKKEEIVYYE